MPDTIQSYQALATQNGQKLGHFLETIGKIGMDNGWAQQFFDLIKRMMSHHTTQIERIGEDVSDIKAKQQGLESSIKRVHKRIDGIELPAKRIIWIVITAIVGAAVYALFRVG